MASSAARQHSVKAASVTWMLFVSCCWSERAAVGLNDLREAIELLTLLPTSVQEKECSQKQPRVATSAALRSRS